MFAKLPSGFKIPTPVGDCNPDWAVAFKKGKVKYLYFVAETKGSLSGMELRKIEQAKISYEQCSLTRAAKCHRKHVVTDDELRIYKPGIFGVFCPVPVNKLARNVVVVKRNEIPR